MSLVQTNSKRAGLARIPSNSAQQEIQAASGIVGLAVRQSGKTGAETSFKVFSGSEVGPRVEIINDGSLKWGSGAGATDAFLLRQAAGHLRVYASSPTLSLQPSAGAQPTISVNGGGSTPSISFGPGSSTVPDVSISRDSTGRLSLNGTVQGTIAQINTSLARTGGYLDTYVVDRAVGGGSASGLTVTKVDRQIRPAYSDFSGHALSVSSLIGDDGTASVGTSHGITSLQQIFTCGNSNNEYTPLAVYMTDLTTANSPRSWLTDWIQVGPTVRPDLFNGFTVCMNNHYNGTPVSGGLSAAVEITTQRWAPGWATGTGAIDSRATYPIACGIHVTGSSNTSSIGGNERDGFSVGVRVGGQGHAWPNAGARVGKAIEISDWRTHGLHVSGRFSGSTGPAIQVDSGYGEIVGLNGVVTKVKAGAPIDGDFNNPQSGMIAVDTTNNRIYVRVGTTWRFAALT